MNLLIIQPRLSYYFGGGELISFDFIQTLVKDSQFKKITLITTKPLNNYSNYYINFKTKMENCEKLQIIELEVSDKYKYIYEVNPGEDRSRWDLESLMFSRIMNESDIDLKPYNFSISFYILDGLALPSNLTNIIYLLGYPKENNELRKSLLTMYDIILANSQSVLENWEKDMTISQISKTKVLLQGLNFKEVEKESIFIYDKNYKNIVFTGRLIKRKGILELIKAISIIQNSGIKVMLHIYGEGPLLPEIEDLINQLDLLKIVKLYGFCDDVKNKLPNADLCCFPSHSKEGLMSSVLEAMYYNGLVVTTTNNGSESVIENKKSGFLIAPNDTEKLALKIIEILDLDPKEVKTIRLRAKESIIKNCNWDVFANEFIEIITNHSTNK